MYELLIANKETGKIWDVSNLVDGEVEVSTQRSGAPAEIDFTVILNGISFGHGDIIRFSEDGELIFYGYVFTMTPDRWNRCEVTGYDRLRYLKTNATYAFYAMTAGDIIKQIAEDLQLDVGYLEDTGYKIPSLIESDKSCMDIIQDAINQTLLNTGEIYIFYDNGIGLSLIAARDWVTDITIGDKALVTDYNYSTTIDANVYNAVKLGKANEEEGTLETVIAQDSDNIERWGRLQLFQTIDEDLNTAQMGERAEATLKYYNRVRRTLSLESLGVPGLRAGMMIKVLLSRVGLESMAAMVLLESVVHTYGHDTHTMELETLELTDDLIGRATEDQ